jgi:hypothetical protein
VHSLPPSQVTNLDELTSLADVIAEMRRTAQDGSCLERQILRRGSVAHHSARPHQLQSGHCGALRAGDDHFLLPQVALQETEKRDLVELEGIHLLCGNWHVELESERKQWQCAARRFVDGELVLFRYVFV